MQSNNLSDTEEKFQCKKFVLFPFIVYILLYTIFFILPYKPIISYSVVYIGTSLVFILLCFYISKTHLPVNYIYFFIIIAVILRLAVLFILPTGSEDFYRYVWDGKVIANGINPYQYAPSDEALLKLHSETLPQSVSFRNIKTVYPPLSLIIFYAGYIIGGESFWGIKILLLIFELFTFLGLSLILKELKLPQKNILFYVLAPLPVFQLFIDAHLDGFGITLLIFSIYFYIRNKKVLSFIFIGLSICIKPLALILIPILFFIEKGIKAKVQIVIVPLLVCTLLYLPFIFTANVFEALTDFTVNWTFNGFVFEILNSFLNNNQITRLICGILFLIVFIVIIFSKKDLLNKIYLSVFLLLIFSPIVHPWYVTWLAVLLPFIPRWSGIFFTSLISLTVFTVLNFQLNGEWKNYPAVLFLEYVPVLILFLFELKMKKFSKVISLM